MAVADVAGQLLGVFNSLIDTIDINIVVADAVHFGKAHIIILGGFRPRG